QYWRRRSRSVGARSVRAVSALRQAQHALADDVALDLTGAAGDRGLARGDYAAGPFATLDSSRRPALEIRVRAEHLVREHCQPQAEFCRAQFSDRTLRSRHSPPELCAHRTITAKPDASRLRRKLREPLADVRTVA